MKNTDKSIKITNSNNNGAEEIEVPISLGDLKYWSGVTSIL